MINYDKTKFFEAIRNLSEYQVGKEYYFMHQGKIVKGKIIEVRLKVDDPGALMSVKNYLRVDFSIVMRHGGETNVYYPSQLFESREEAAEQFLKDNDVPSELLKVLKPERSKTTVADLITKLQELNPELDLESDFWKVLTPVTRRMLPVELNDEYWDCECPEYYIHPKEHQFCEVCGAEKQFCPSSRADELKVENMTKQKE